MQASGFASPNRPEVATNNEQPVFAQQLYFIAK
jgi:hypothetical protein